MIRPYINKKRDVIICPKCNYIFYNRTRQRCPKCKVGLKLNHEFVMFGDFYYDEYKWITYEELCERIRNFTS